MTFASAHKEAEKQFYKTDIPMAVVRYPSGNYGVVTLHKAQLENLTIIYTFK